MDDNGSSIEIKNSGELGCYLLCGVDWSERIEELKEDKVSKVKKSRTEIKKKPRNSVFC